MPKANQKFNGLPPRKRSREFNSDTDKHHYNTPKTVK